MHAFQWIVVSFCIIVFTSFSVGVKTGMKVDKSYEDIIKGNCQKLIDENIVDAMKARTTKDFKCYLRFKNIIGDDYWREATKEEFNLLPY